MSGRPREPIVADAVSLERAAAAAARFEKMPRTAVEGPRRRARLIDRVRTRARFLVNEP